VPYQLIAILPNGQQKSMLNRDEAAALDHVTEFVNDGTITTRWGNNTQTRQALEIRVYQTAERYDKRTHGTLETFLKRKRNVFDRLEKEVLEKRVPQRRPRVFVVMAIQGDRYGSQSEQTVYREFNERFAVIEGVLREFGCVAIRIDREQALGGLVDRIKEEIRRARFVIADLTDERPSCYFEVGYTEALGKPFIPVASKESVMEPGTPTKIHFDIHQNVRFFTNHEELAEKLRDAIQKNQDELLAPPDTADTSFLAFRALEQPVYRRAVPSLRATGS
jgi:hypothetical protein